jgi:hypothetical protein
MKSTQNTGNNNTCDPEKAIDDLITIIEKFAKSKNEESTDNEKESEKKKDKIMITNTSIRKMLEYATKYENDENKALRYIAYLVARNEGFKGINKQTKEKESMKTQYNKIAESTGLAYLFFNILSTCKNNLKEYLEQFAMAFYVYYKLNEELKNPTEVIEFLKLTMKTSGR